MSRLDNAREARRRMDATQHMARRGVKTDGETMTAADLEQVAALFDAWQPGIDYAVDAIVADPTDGQLYKCLQAHAAQDGWAPHATPALWHRLGLNADDPDAIPEWVQPTGAGGYNQGAKVRHGGKVWQSTVDNNVWEPGAQGVTQWLEVEATA